jgi:hypothetical protein
MTITCAFFEKMPLPTPGRMPAAGVRTFVTISARVTQRQRFCPRNLQIGSTSTNQFQQFVSSGSQGL